MLCSREFSIVSTAVLRCRKPDGAPQLEARRLSNAELVIGCSAPASSCVCSSCTFQSMNLAHRE